MPETGNEVFTATTSSRQLHVEQIQHTSTIQMHNFNISMRAESRDWAMYACSAISVG